MSISLNKNSIVFLTSFFLALQLSFPSNANQDPIHIYANSMNFETSDEELTFYTDIAKLIIPSETHPHTLNIVPHIRSSHLFFADKTSCRYPSNLKALSEHFDQGAKIDFIETKAFLMNSLRIFSASGVRPPRSIEDLKGHTITVPTSSTTLQGHPEIKLVHSPTEEHRVQVLLANRVELMLGSIITVQLMANKMGAQLPTYDQNFTLGDFTLHISCHNTEKNRHFIAAVNERITQALSDGDLQTVLIKHGLDPDIVLPR